MIDGLEALNVQPYVTEFIKQVPGLFILALIVRWFLSHLARVEKDRDEMADRQGQLMDKITVRVEQVMDRVGDVLVKNAEIVGRSVEVIGRLDAIGSILHNAAARLDFAVTSVHRMEAQLTHHGRSAAVGFQEPGGYPEPQGHPREVPEPVGEVKKKTTPIADVVQQVGRTVVDIVGKRMADLRGECERRQV